jgi:hypothetical protein
MPRTRRSRRAAYPQAAIAAYGPDNTFATKLVVAVIDRPGQEPTELRTWVTRATDVRNEPVIAADVAEFLEERGVKETVATDGIIGCPHEEGIDYPMGRVCPQCPFWATIDRFTHEPIVPPVATMSADEIVAALRTGDQAVAAEALVAADAQRPALVGPLIAGLSSGIAEAFDPPDEDASLFAYAIYLLAAWRETRAYPEVVRWLSLPGDGPFDLVGDIVTEDGGRILAAVCDGDLEPIKALVLDAEANEYGRSMAIEALALLAAWAEVPRQDVVDYFTWLATEGLERGRTHLWDSLAAACAEIEALPALPALREAYDRKWIDPDFIGRDEVEQAMASEGRSLADMRERHPPIFDVVAATSWWSRGRPALTAARAPASSSRPRRD